jgi:hypothetical protein
VSLAWATKSVHGYEPLAPQCACFALLSLSLFLLLLVISVLL